MPATLERDAIHLWCAFFSEITDPALLREYERMLSEPERQRRSQFVFAHDGHRFLVTRALLRTVLSRYADVAAAQWVFAANAYGRPEIANRHSQTADLSFNISHTNGLIAVAVARSRALGVDTENVDRPVSLSVADRVFAPAERAALYTVPAEGRQRRFFEHWTLKESYIKARAIGLSIPLDEIRFAFIGDKRVEMSADPDAGHSPSRWLFWQFSVEGGHLVAVCAERTDTDVPRLVVQQTVPLVAESPLSMRDLRMSAEPRRDADESGDPPRQR